jgi:hypothetical protein
MNQPITQLEAMATCDNRLPFLLTVVALLGFAAVNARADITIGAPTNHTASRPGPPGFSTSLIPDPVIHDAVPAAGGLLDNTFKADVAQYPGWTLQFGAALKGSLAITDYLAVVNGNRGGARMDATYTPAATDPAGLTFMQVFVDNSATHIDPFPNDDTEPFYYTAAERTTHGLNFIDNPDDLCPNRCPDKVTFDTYLVSFNAAAKVATVYDGWRWGFQIVAVPEPSVVVLLLLGSLVAIAMWRIRESSHPQQADGAAST